MKGEGVALSAPWLRTKEKYNHIRARTHKYTLTLWSESSLTPAGQDKEDKGAGEIIPVVSKPRTFDKWSEGPAVSGNKAKFKGQRVSGGRQASKSEKDIDGLTEMSGGRGGTWGLRPRTDTSQKSGKWGGEGGRCITWTPRPPP